MPKLASSNQQVLTRGDRKLASKRAGRAESVVFDPKSREDYLTGFHKRKVKRKEEAKKRAEEFAHKQHLEERRKMREDRQKSIDRGLERLQDAQALITGKKSIENDDELSEEGESGDGAGANTASATRDGDEFQGFSDSSGILKGRKSVTYEGENGRSTAEVVFEPLSIDPYVDMSRSEDVLNESTRKAHEYARFVQGLDNAPTPQEPKKKQRKKKFRYKQPLS